MSPHTARLSALLALACSTACSGTQSSHGTAPVVVDPSAVGVRNFTDSDVVTGVGVTRTEVFVGTLRGVLRFPLAGGEATRLGLSTGLPSDVVYAVSATPDGDVWVATARGVARWDGARWMVAGSPDAQANVGRVTALLALAGGQALLGGAQGLARFDGSAWLKLTDQYQVVSLALDQGQPVVATANAGVLAVRGDYTALDEYSTASGIPETLVRAVVPLGSGRFWALLQGSNGAKLAYFDGHRWIGYTSTDVRSQWMALVPTPGRSTASLVVQGGLYELVADRAELALVATDVGNADGKRRIALTPVRVEAPAPAAPAAPAAPPAPPAPPPGRHRGRHASVTPAMRGAQTAPGAAEAHANAPVPPPATPPPPAAAVRPRNIPPFAGPVDPPSSGPALEAPRFGLAPVSGASLGTDLSAAFAVRDALFVSRVGLGVTRVTGGPRIEFQAHDLALTHRALSLATDATGKVWLVTDDGGAVRFDGSHFARIPVDTDPEAVPLVFWSRGTTAAAIARIGPNQLRAYRFAGTGWRQVTQRPIDTRGPGTVEPRFLAVDDRGRYWVGIRVVNEGRTRDLGVAVLDDALPAATQFHSQVPPAGGEQGAVPGPDDVSAIEFDRDGAAWLAGVTGATRITYTGAGGSARAVVRTFNEATGMRGDIVNDIARGPGDKLFVATSEGLGYWDTDHFAFDIEGSGAAARASALAADNNGALWGAGMRGAWVYDGHAFRAAGRPNGVPSDEYLDLAVDGENRVWFATPTGLSVLTQARPGASGTSATGNGAASGGSELGI